MMLRFTFVDAFDEVHLVVHSGLGQRLYTDVIPLEAIHDWNTTVDEGDMSLLDDPASEEEIAETLGPRLLPHDLAEVLTSRGHTDSALVIHPSPSVATVPFGLLAVSPGVRLMQRCRVRRAHPYGLTANRVNHSSGGHLLTVVDPRSPMPPVLDEHGHDRWQVYCQQNPEIHDAGSFVSRYDLHSHLTTDPPDALLFYGHCTANLESPLAGSGLVLSDRDRSDGETRSRPLTANDLVVGTLTHPERNLPRDTRGSEIWPMPKKTAILGCSSGSAARSIEPLGLASVLYTSGAEWLAATLWDVPADAATGGFTTTMAMAIASALTRRYPGKILDSWLLDQLARWRNGADGTGSPRTWGALAQFVGGTSDLRRASTA